MKFQNKKINIKLLICLNKNRKRKGKFLELKHSSNEIKLLFSSL